MLISLYDTQADMQIITVITFETADPARGRGRRPGPSSRRR